MLLKVANFELDNNFDLDFNFHFNLISSTDTIVAISTPSGQGALGVIRLTGNEAISLVNGVFQPKDLSQAAGHSLHYGKLMKGETILDEVVVSVFRAPRSFTREDVVEISCHGSSFILGQALQLLVDQGARLAQPGEFTQRAFLNGAMDLAQAEAVADLIASSSAGSHQLAMNQMRGGVSRELKSLRAQLLHFTSMIELELDFGEEDVEFADRSELNALVERILDHLEQLIQSFSLGNAIKRGVPTTIIGKPNAGKSTLLNALLNDNRAIVSDIPGTTRDVVEDRFVIQGIEFRLQDTAGLRETGDVIEAEGVRRSLDLAQIASLVIYLFDSTQETPEAAAQYVKSLDLPETAQVIVIGNKSDLLPDQEAYASQYDTDLAGQYPWLLISAKTGTYLDGLHDLMLGAVAALSDRPADQPMISNVRHLTALQGAQGHLQEVLQALADGIPSDLMAIDIRAAIHHIGEITGEISTDEVLGNIFANFCIGK